MLAKNTNFKNAGNFYIQLARDMENRIWTTFECPKLLEESYQSAAHVFFHFPVTLWEDFLGCLERLFFCTPNLQMLLQFIGKGIIKHLAGWISGKYKQKTSKSLKKITAKSSKVQSFTNKHPTSQVLSMRFLHLSLCPQASKASSSPCSQNEPCAVPQKRCSLFWA